MKRFNHFRRPRRGQSKGYTPADAAHWRRLVREARHIARAPLADAGRLYEAAQRCVRAVMPPGYVFRDSPFMRLSLKARAFWSLDLAARPAAAPELAQLADACDAALDHPTNPAPPPRADIFG